MYISVLTPTYNRAEYLTKLYKSLCVQTRKDFEWLIIDDGSTDSTKELCNSFILENKIKIKYYKKENGGKHRALNFGVSYSEGDFIFIVDSDDYLLENAIEKIYLWLSDIAEKSEFAGVSGLRGYSQSQPIGQFPFGKKFVDCTNLERRKNKLMGDKAEIYRKELLMKIPFPEFEGEKFLGEGAVWNMIAERGYKIRWFGEIIYVTNYLEGGLTKSSDKYHKNFEGFTYNSRLIVDNVTGLEKLYAIYKFRIVAMDKGLSDNEIVEKLGIKKWELKCSDVLFKMYKFIKR